MAAGGLPAIGGTPTNDKANKFHGLQLRSLLDLECSCPESATDTAWAKVLSSKELRSAAETDILLSLPSSEHAEASLLSAVEHLAEALQGESGLAAFYRHFGWSSAEDYFTNLGEDQVMFVDTDHNDSDDRLAAVLLAYQMASANLERRKKVPDASCRLYLDGRTYESSSLTVWRTLRLAARLHAALFASCGLAVEPVFKDGPKALRMALQCLGKAAGPAEKIEQLPPGAAATLQGTGPGAIRQNFLAALASNGPLRHRVSIWILSGLCREQVEDIQVSCGAASGPVVRFNIFEQAQPAWHSGTAPVEGETLEPRWTWPASSLDEVEKGWGAEPSNVRSGERSYPEILHTYLELQKIVAASAPEFMYVCPALARQEGTMPVPCGQPLCRVSGRPLYVIPGSTYQAKKALDQARVEKAFSALLRAAKDGGAGTAPLHEELCISTKDELGNERREMAHIEKYGTSMADAILVVLAARPVDDLKTQPAIRCLAAVQAAEEMDGGDFFVSFDAPTVSTDFPIEEPHEGDRRWSCWPALCGPREC